MTQVDEAKSVIRAASEGIQVWRLKGVDSPDVYVSPSRTEQGVAHRIQFVDGVADCTCSSFEYRRTCKHASQASAVRDAWLEIESKKEVVL